MLQAILIEKLWHQLAGHCAHRFGASSETAEQLQLALEASEVASAAMTAKLRLPNLEKNKPKRRPLPDHIPRQEVELTPGGDCCADCGGRLRRFGEDVTEEIKYVPSRFVVNRIVRPRLAYSSCERFTQATLPSRPIEGGRPGPGLLAYVLQSGPINMPACAGCPRTCPVGQSGRDSVGPRATGAAPLQAVVGARASSW